MRDIEGMGAADVAALAMGELSALTGTESAVLWLDDNVVLASRWRSPADGAVLTGAWTCQDVYWGPDGDIQLTIDGAAGSATIHWNDEGGSYDAEVPQPAGGLLSRALASAWTDGRCTVHRMIHDDPELVDVKEDITNEHALVGHGTWDGYDGDIQEDEDMADLLERMGSRRPRVEVLLGEDFPDHQHEREDD